MHPRIFAALGSDLVTNDIVAMIELVKNSYDAFATRVDVRFGTNEQGAYIEIEDDGLGMSNAIIDDVWCVVATPYRQMKPYQAKGNKSRRASGEKGLGRLSAARLGTHLEMVTKPSQLAGWQVDVDWTGIEGAGQMNACYATRKKLITNPFNSTGTRIRISQLRSEWTEEKVADLRDNLSRLLSPFESVEEFTIWLTPPGETALAVEVESPEFLSHPPYLITGKLSKEGTLTFKYTYTPITGKRRLSGTSINWETISGSLPSTRGTESESPRCGPFRFEIRAWDIGPDDVEDIAEHFNLQKGLIRRSIRAFKGISLYRDSILVLPKSDTARDWLGLDLRRVSKVGTRLSTSQIIGYVAVTASNNKKIDDTSDRERLVQNEEVREFQDIIKYVVAAFETERDQDRREAKHEEPPLRDIFKSLSSSSLIESIDQLVRDKADASEALPLVTDFSRELDRAREQIEQRFIYYSRLATVGTIAQMLVHEVGNKTLVIGRLLTSVKELIARSDQKHDELQREVVLAEQALDALGGLAERFSPLANRSFNSRKRDCIAEDIIDDCLHARADVISRLKIEVAWKSNAETRVGIDPGELFAVVFNLIDNALYWLNRRDEGQRRLRVTAKTVSNAKRLEIQVHDSGPGVKPGDEQRIFWPGVTRRPNGIGMGLTIASELVAEHGGKMRLIQPGDLGGATFAFDLPIAPTTR